jgi:hypothetical protein
LENVTINGSTPILFECKNWSNKVGAKEIEAFSCKATPAKTGFFVAWKGITGRDELGGARKTDYDN